MEHTLGSKIFYMKAPAISAVTRSLENRILGADLNALPEEELDPAALENSVTVDDNDGAIRPGNPVLPQTRLGRKLVKKLGAETAVEALIAMAFGEKLDPARYGAITELDEAPQRELEAKQRFGKGKHAVPRHSIRHEGSRHAKRFGDNAGAPFSAGSFPHGERVYVGLGRRHGATARNVADLLMRAGGVPGRLVDAIEMKDYCAFATLPEDAARRACAFSKNTPEDPIIKPAFPGDFGERERGKHGAARRERW
jgi:ATP-dependent RNA helicase DeaD